MLPPAGISTATQVFAGVTLVALSLPLNIGYSQAAGLSVAVGISASILPMIAFAILSGSRALVTGPDATIAALLAAILPTLAVSSGATPEQLALGVALLTGLIIAAMWLTGAGVFVRFISKAVLVGFLAGLAIDILTSQVEKIVGVSVDTGAWFTDVIAILTDWSQWSIASIVVGVGTITITRLCRRFLPRWPGPLIALVIVGGAVAWLQPAGVSVLGEVPSGFPPLSVPNVGWDVWGDLVATALAIAVLTVAEGLLIAGQAARAKGDDFDSNAELFPLAATNVVAAFTSSMPIGASSSRTTALQSAGMRSQLPALVAGIIVTAIALWFTGLVSYIPMAALGGLVANAVVAIIDVAAFRQFARTRGSEFVIAVGCTVGVLVLGPIGGLALATGVSLIDLIRRLAAAPWVTLIPPEDSHETGRFVAGDPGAVDRGITFLRVSGPLFFANADTLRSSIATLMNEPDLRWIVLDFESVTDIDNTAAEALADSFASANSTGTVIALTRVSAPIRQLLATFGLLDVIRPDNIYASNRAAFAAFQEFFGSLGD